MKAEIIMIGTELLLGQIVDTNASYLAKQLAETGFNLYHKTTVGDNDARITESIRNTLLRSDVVITSGGLGPTVDDKTRAWSICADLVDTGYGQRRICAGETGCSGN